MEFVKKYNLEDLAELKEYRYSKIDKRTGELIGLGFTYNGIVFSLSDNAQKNLLGTYSAKELLTYPFAWSAKDDSSTYDILDVADMSAFFMTALGTKKAHQDSGTALKTQVREAVDIAAVNAITDNR